MRKKIPIVAIAIAFALSIFTNSCGKVDLSDLHGDHGHGDNYTASTVATSWYKLQLRILLERNSALNGAYFAYIGIGLYESVRHDEKKAESFASKLYQMPAMPARQSGKDYNWLVSANAAMATMVRSFYGGLTPANQVSIDSLEKLFNDKLQMHTSTSTFNRSQEYGRSVAQAIYNWSLTDNYYPSNAGYVPPVFPGAWQPTPPAFANGVLPFIKDARPLLSSIATDVAPAFPFAYSEDPKSDFYNMVKKLYDVSLGLTEEQKNIALFWVDQGNGVGYTPPGHDMSIITQVIDQKKSSLVEAAEAYAKAGIAEREATIICFRSKYKYNLIRPVTYIQKLIDPSWMPFIGTPPHPEYPAAHAFVTGAVMQAVSKVLGDHTWFTDHTYDFRGWAPRTYANLFKSAEEAGISRLYGGIHYLPSINTGLSLAKDLGGKIGKIGVRD